MKTIDCVWNKIGVNIEINTSLVTDHQAIEFSLAYIERWQSDEVLNGFRYTPAVKKAGRNINIIFYEYKDKFVFSINGNTHLTMNVRGFHNMQLRYELESHIHETFFIQAHFHQTSLKDLISRIVNKKYWTNL